MKLMPPLTAACNNRHNRIGLFLLVLLALTLYIPRQLFASGLSFFGDELFINYWCWRIDWGSFFHLLPTGQHDDRPLGWLFINLIYESFGLNYRLQLLAILLVHYSNSLLLFVFSRKIFKKDVIAMVVAVAFALHFPANSAALYIGAIFDLLCCTFTLAALLCYVYHEKGTWSVPLLLSLFFFYLSLRSKEMTLLLPVVLAVLSFSPPNGNRPAAVWQIFLRVLPFFLTSVLVVAIFFAKGRICGVPVAPESPYYMDFSLKTFLALLNHYCSLLTWIPERYWPVCLLLLITLAALMRHGILLWAVSGFLLTLLPVLFYKNHIFDIFVYVPHLFFSIIVGALVDLCCRWTRHAMGENILALFVSLAIIATNQTAKFDGKMQIELVNRRAIDLLITFLNKNKQIEGYESVYFADLPRFYMRNGRNWHLSNVMSLVYMKETFSVFTGESDQYLYEEYLRKAGSKVFLRYNNGFVVEAHSGA